MSYYQGDYYRGDPGIFGFLGGVVKKGLGVATSLIPGPAGAIARAGYSAAFGGRAAAPPLPTGARSFAGTPPILLMPGGAMAAVPGGLAGKSERSRAAMGLPPKRRRMNVTNDKALRRAIRRTDGFVRLAKRALRGTGYTVVTRASRAKKVSVRESGAGSVTVH